MREKEEKTYKDALRKLKDTKTRHSLHNFIKILAFFKVK